MLGHMHVNMITEPDNKWREIGKRKELNQLVNY